jgi:putative mRNA 3-end processing factor
MGPIYVHEEVERFSRIYREQGIPLPLPTSGKPQPGAILIAPASLLGTPWACSFGPMSSATASGWMRIRGTRRRQPLDRGLVFSDHADWPELLRAIDESGAGTVCVMGNFRALLVRWLEEQGRRAYAIAVGTEIPEE